MTGAERGFLLLCSRLGNPERKPLTTSQFRQLTQRARDTEPSRETRDMTPEDLLPLGYGGGEARRIVALLDDELLLDRYLEKAAKKGCHPLTRISSGYPRILRQRLGDDAPGCLWYKGDPELLEQPGIALVGSRELYSKNREFAALAGIQAARQGFSLISGNARGADRTAQDAALDHGGTVISVVADELERHEPARNQLFLSEDGFDQEFGRIRALSRNRVIHALGMCTLVAQSGLEKGGTWDGTVRNLRRGWSPVFCFDDGSLSCDALEQLGAGVIDKNQLEDLKVLCQPDRRLI